MKLNVMSSIESFLNLHRSKIPVQFHDIHDNYKALLRNMTSKCKRVKKRAKFNKFWKKVAGFSLVTSYTALSIAFLVIAIHSMVGIVAATVAPVFVACSLGIFKKTVKLAKNGPATSLLDRLGAQIDVAAKGLYILINDLDTMSRLVRRLQDEVEHSKAIANVCVRNHGKLEVLKQVVKEFHIH